MSGADKAAVAALGISLQFDLGAGRVATVQTHVANDCSLADIDAMFDKMTAAGDRQRAHYKIEELEASLESEERVQAQHAEDLMRIDREYDEAQAKRFAEAGKAQTVVDNFMSAHREKHAERGGRGDPQLKGGDLSRYNSVNSGIDKIKAEIAKAEAEHAVAHTNSSSTFKRRADLIARAKIDIQKCRDIVARKN